MKDRPRRMNFRVRNESQEYMIYFTQYKLFNWALRNNNNTKTQYGTSFDKKRV